MGNLWFLRVFRWCAVKLTLDLIRVSGGQVDRGALLVWVTRCSRIKASLPVSQFFARLHVAFSLQQSTAFADDARCGGSEYCTRFRLLSARTYADGGDRAVFGALLVYVLRSSNALTGVDLPSGICEADAYGAALSQLLVPGESFGMMVCATRSVAEAVVSPIVTCTRVVVGRVVVSATGNCLVVEACHICEVWVDTPRPPMVPDTRPWDVSLWRGGRGGIAAWLRVAQGFIRASVVGPAATLVGKCTRSS